MSKKILSLLLAVVMVFSLGVSAFAADVNALHQAEQEIQARKNSTTGIQHSNDSTD